MEQRLKIKVAYDMVSTKPLKEAKLTTAEKNKLAKKLEDQVIETLTSETFSIENIEVSLETFEEGEGDDTRHMC